MHRLEVDKLIADRKQARENGDWDKSDSIRSLLANSGIKIVDTKNGQEVDAGTEHEFIILESYTQQLMDEVERTHLELVEATDLIGTQKDIIYEFLWKKYRADYLTKGWMGLCYYYKQLTLEKRGQN